MPKGDRTPSSSEADANGRKSLGTVFASLPDLSIVNRSAAADDTTLNRTLRFEAIRPQNIKEMTNEIAYLRSDNFNLRARIFVMKSKLRDFDDDDDDEMDIANTDQLDEANAEIENLKQELNVKDQTLKEALFSKEEYRRQLLEAHQRLNQAKAASDLLVKDSENKDMLLKSLRSQFDEAKVRIEELTDKVEAAASTPAESSLIKEELERKENEINELKDRIQLLELKASAKEEETQTSCQKEKADSATVSPLYERTISFLRPAPQPSPLMQSTSVESGIAVPNQEFVTAIQEMYADKVAELASLQAELATCKAAAASTAVVNDLPGKIQALTDQLTARTDECKKRDKVIHALLRRLEDKQQADAQPAAATDSFLDVVRRDVSVLNFLQKSSISRSDMDELRSKFTKYQEVNQRMLKRLKTSAQLVEEVVRMLGDDVTARRLLASLSMLQSDLSETLNFTSDFIFHIESESQLLVEDAETQESAEPDVAKEGGHREASSRAEMSAIRSLETKVQSLEAELKVERQRALEIRRQIEDKDKEIYDLLQEKVALSKEIKDAVTTSVTDDKGVQVSDSLTLVNTFPVDAGGEEAKARSKVTFQSPVSAFEQQHDTVPVESPEIEVPTLPSRLPILHSKMAPAVRSAVLEAGEANSPPHVEDGSLSRNVIEEKDQPFKTQSSFELSKSSTGGTSRKLSDFEFDAAKAIKAAEQFYAWLSEQQTRTVERETLDEKFFTIFVHLHLLKKRMSPERGSSASFKSLKKSERLSGDEQLSQKDETVGGQVLSFADSPGGVSDTDLQFTTDFDKRIVKLLERNKLLERYAKSIKRKLRRLERLVSELSTGDSAAGDNSGAAQLPQETDLSVLDRAEKILQSFEKGDGKMDDVVAQLRRNNAALEKRLADAEETLRRFAVVSDGLQATEAENQANKAKLKRVEAELQTKVRENAQLSAKVDGSSASQKSAYRRRSSESAKVNSAGDAGKPLVLSVATQSDIEIQGIDARPSVDRDRDVDAVIMKLTAVITNLTDMKRIIQLTESNGLNKTLDTELLLDVLRTTLTLIDDHARFFDFFSFIKLLISENKRLAAEVDALKQQLSDTVEQLKAARERLESKDKVTEEARSALIKDLSKTCKLLKHIRKK